MRKDGRPTRKLLRARKLQKSGAGIRIISETELLGLLGLRDQIDDLNRLYTTSQLTRILGVSSSRIRSWIRSKLISPAKVSKRLAWFDFKEVMMARALHNLVDSGVKAAAIRRSVEEMSKWLPDAERLLLMIEASDETAPIHVRLPDGRIAEPDGQMLLDFAAENGSEPRIKKWQPSAEYQLSGVEAADRWFAAGVLAEEREEWERAAEAYERALLAGGLQAETCFNLGNTLFALGHRAEAAKRYIQAVELDDEYVEAWNNLGNALAALDRLEDALQAYRTALRFEPRYADVYWNLAETYEQLGQWTEAEKHWRAYMEEDPHSSVAEEVRKHLEELAHRNRD
jgi:tetratricopeptide (TPR) repeat protein